MPSVSEKQARFMRMSKSPKSREWLKRHGKKPAPLKVAKEYAQADDRETHYRTSGQTQLYRKGK